MSAENDTDHITSPPNSRKRKRELGVEKLTIDTSLPEPISRKAQRKQKKLENAQQNGKQVLPLPSQKNSQHGPIASDGTAHERSIYGVWIGNLPWTASKSTLKEFITNKTSLNESAVTRLHMPAPKKDQTLRGTMTNNKGFAYIDFKDECTLEAVLLLNESLMGGRKLLIKKAKDFEGRPEKADAQTNETGKDSLKKSGHLKSKRVFVGNLGFDVTKDDLFTHFEACGEITDLHIATFEDTGKCKGYAWITFSCHEAAESAVKGYVNSPTTTERAMGKGTETKRSREKYDKGKHMVNEMQGRLLRCEFAEESKIRYQKRHGKG